MSNQTYEPTQATDSLENSTTTNTAAIDIESVREIIIDQFDIEVWHVTEAALAVHATLLLDDAQCMGLAIAGESSAGKTTVIRFFEGLESQVYRSDGATPASFVSHDSSRTKEELKEIDLLPKLKHRTLLNPDMANWFSGSREAIQEKMATMASLMDGDGYTRDSATHGNRGYTGDYRFNIIGATTPLQKRAWVVMGHTGNRFVFHIKPANMAMGDAVDDVFMGSEYQRRISRCQETIQSFLTHCWDNSGGYGSVEWQTSADTEIRRTIGRLANIVRHARAPIGEDGALHKEGPYRITSMLRDLARGSALLRGRTELAKSDLNVCARVALSTMPKGRRPFVHALLDPSTESSLQARELEQRTGRCIRTVHKQMQLMDQLGFGEYHELETGRNTKELRLNEELMWPRTVDFPSW